ncbi:MAG TPA: energy-coupling factor transporter ATPase [Feifaniaceae bacterium]|nr:energy-coupling factor transporter ATPase [Feifaniaceae bacterium]
MIELKDVSFTYESAPRPALSDISLRIADGEMLAVVGHNGSGKSTLAKHLNGLLLPSSGQVLVDDMDTVNPDNLLSIRQRVGMVFQNPDNQLVTTIVEEDVAFGPESLGVEPSEIRRRVDESLRMVGMTEYAKRAPHMLSGGQKQRIAIAGMLAMHPKVLVLDEATAMLDPEGRREVLSIVSALNREQGMTVVMITQLMEEAALCGRVAVLSKGNLILLDTPRAVFRETEALRLAGLDVPAMVKLRNSLAEAGVNLPGEPIGIEEFAASVERAVKMKRGA